MADFAGAAAKAAAAAGALAAAEASELLVCCVSPMRSVVAFEGLCERVFPICVMFAAFAFFLMLRYCIVSAAIIYCPQHARPSVPSVRFAFPSSRQQQQTLKCVESSCCCYFCGAAAAERRTLRRLPFFHALVA